MTNQHEYTKQPRGSGVVFLSAYYEGTVIASALNDSERTRGNPRLYCNNFSIYVWDCGACPEWKLGISTSSQ